MKAKIYWIMAFVAFIMAIAFWGFGLTFSDAEVRGIFTLISLSMIMSEFVLIVMSIAHKIKGY